MAVINPSFFEGWSTTVEEVKSVGKKIVLSDLEVHREQAPDSAYFFAPDDVKDLHEVLSQLWANNEGGPDFELEEKARQTFHRRQVEFGKLYIKYIKNIELK